MKKSEVLLKMQRLHGIRFCMVEGGYITLEEFYSEMLEALEDLGMKPKKYINPRAVDDGLIDPKGETWSYLGFIDKYPEHHFPRGRPYEFYLNGWEPEDE